MNNISIPILERLWELKLEFDKIPDSDDAKNFQDFWQNFLLFKKIFIFDSKGPGLINAFIETLSGTNV